MSNYKYILFDFDGTLADSSEGIYNSLTYAFESYGHGQPPAELLKKFIGPPLYHSFTVFCGFDDTHAWEMTRKYRERYKEKGYLESRIYDGVAETLKRLKEQGYILATASSKPLHFVDQICENLGIKQYFDLLGGTEFDNTSELKSTVIQNVMDKIGATADNTLMVGDRLFDIEGAHQVGIPCCAVLYGFGNREEFEEYKADYIVEKPEEILDLVK